MSFSVGYAYRRKLKNEATLGLGISLGGISYKLNSPSEWGSYDDAAIPKRKEAASTGFDMGLGAYYDRGDFYVGASCMHLNQPRVLTVESGEHTFTIKRTFYLNGGYRWQTPYESFEVYPTALLMFTALAKPQLGFGANVMYEKKHWGGLYYRIRDALGAMGGMSVGEAVKMGIAYEYSLSKLAGANRGNLEVFIAYSFEVKFTKKVKKYKSIRFL